MNEETIFAEALEKLDLQERAAFLDLACAGNAQLRESVQSLLVAYEAGEFLESPHELPAAMGVVAIAEGIGTVIGPYKLMEQIGEGGFGVVFVAEQFQPVRRKVALKVLKPGMDTRQVIARFEAERQALALMDHPHIAKVLDAGATESGRPYFVMELVKGIPITEYCEQSRLGTRERLALFVDVCQAVQHAHHKGIIHRDLKPSNVLVTQIDGKPVAKVIDFGIAKATGQQLTDKTLYTGFAQLIGTPQYMSPEQAALSGVDVDTRSDVYSLGVMLYELLTGTTPFTKETFSNVSYDELRRIIREEEPPRPSTRLSTLQSHAVSTIATRQPVDAQQLSRQLRGELDWIVMQALEKDRNLRYESASAFAADVERYLHDEPVQACPPSAGYRFRKFTRKHRVTLATGAVVAVALLIGAAVSAWQAVRATNAENRANANAALALAGERTAREEQQKAVAAAAAERAAKQAEATQRQRAEASERQAIKNFEAALEAVDRLLAHVGATELNDVPRVQSIRRKILQDAIQFYERFLVESENSAAIRFRMAKTWTSMAILCTALGDYDSAERAYEPAISLLKQLVAEEPRRDEYRQALAESQVAAGYFYDWAIPRREKMENRFREAADLYQQLAEDHPENVNFVKRKALAENHLILKRADLGGRDEAIAHTRRTIAELEHSPTANAYERGTWWRRLAELLAPVDPTGADDAVRRAVAEYRKDFRINKSSEDRVQFAHLLNFAGRHLGSRYTDDAKEFFREGETLLRALIDDYPTNPHYRMHLAWNLRNQAELSAGQLKLPAVKIDPAEMVRLLTEADAGYEEAVQIVRQLVVDFPSQLRHGEPHHREQRHQEELIGFLWEQSSHLRQLSFRDDEKVAVGLSAERTAKAEQLLRERLATAQLAQAAPSNKDYEKLLADCIVHLADLILQASDRDDEALVLLEGTGETHPQLPAIHQRLAQRLAKQGSPEEAIAALSEQIGRYPGAAGYYSQRAKLAAGLGRVEEAIDDYNRAIELNPAGIQSIVDRGDLYTRKKNYERAIIDYTRVLDLPGSRWWVSKRRAIPRIFLGQFDGALADLGDALQAQPDDGSIFTWMPLDTIAQCDNETFKAEFLGLVNEAVRLNKGSIGSRLNRAHVLTAFGRFDQAKHEYDEVVQAGPEPGSASAFNNFAWLLATAADQSLRQSARAVELGKRAIELDSNNGSYWNTLGAAQYCAGDWRAAIAAIDQSMMLRQGGDSFDWFFLAMSYWQRGDQQLARQWFDRAVEWMDKNQSENEELRRFRAEAAELLGIAEATDEPASATRPDNAGTK